MKQLRGNKKAWLTSGGNVKIKYGEQTTVITEEEYDTIGELFE